MRGVSNDDSPASDVMHVEAKYLQHVLSWSIQVSYSQSYPSPRKLAGRERIFDFFDWDAPASSTPIVVVGLLLAISHVIIS